MSISGVHWVRGGALVLTTVALGWILTPRDHAASPGPQTVPESTVMPAEQAARTMVVPEGFRVNLFAGEPDVQQPIGFCLDDRGRLWVAEAYNYPHHGTTPGDRIIILEDQDGDGRHDRRTVFFEGLNYVTGIEVGFGGAWVMSPPSLYFIPDQDGNDVPDSSPQVLLDGFGNHANAHNLANGFAWGPDGWLYGTHGRTNWSKIGRPGTPDSERVVFDGGVYRYHPVRHEWEPWADGTTNPWGIDWNDHGEAFVCNCVNPHLFHVIPGAHYEPWRNRKSSEFAFERIPTIADHLHFVGGSDVRHGLGTAEEDAAGGGHAHCGTMVYLGDNWPAEYRNGIFMNNIHGHRINHDVPRRQGSGYTASHGADLMRSRDNWFMGVTLQYGPDGSVFVSDWSDTGECHSVRNTQRQTGRIYRIRYGAADVHPGSLPALKSATDQQLVDLQRHPNDWWVRHARRILQERHAAGRSLDNVRTSLKELFASQTDVTRQLRALWALHAIEGDDEAFLTELLQHPNEYLQAWAVRLLGENGSPPAEALRLFCDPAVGGRSPFVRLALASVLQRLTAAQRWELARVLSSHEEDENDPNLPLMLWYGIEPLIHADPTEFASLAGSSRLSLVRRHVARRAALLDPTGPAVRRLVQLLTDVSQPQRAADILQGLLTGFEGHRSVPLPPAWNIAFAGLQKSSDPAVRELSLRLALLFSDPSAVTALQRKASDRSCSAEERTLAIEALVARRIPAVAEMLPDLVADPVTQQAALRGLAEFRHPQTTQVILNAWPSMDATSRQTAIQTLASRAEWARQLLTAVEQKIVARADLTAYTARQIASLGQPDLDQKLTELWGNVRETPADRRRQIASYRKQLTPDSMAQANLATGRLLYRKHCANCHRLFDDGGRIGPDITGSQRMNPDYVLENLIDPSAAVSRDYQMEILQTTAGRVVTGLIESENRQAVTIQTVNERLVIPVAEIDDRAQSDVSMMPEGLLKPLSANEVRDLLAYLASPRQVALPVE